MSVRYDYPAALVGRPVDVGPDQTRIYWRKSKDRDRELLTAQGDFSAPQLEAGQKLLKQSRQRFIFRQSSGSKSYVIKLFPLSFLGSKLRHPKYAYREFSNTLTARARGVPVAKPVAFLEKRALGLVSCCGIVQKSLERYTDLLTLYREGEIDYDRVAAVAAPVLARVYEAGANHVDLRDENIMLNQKNGKTRVIDWQYANFTQPRAPWLLEYLIAYFIKLGPENQRERLIATLPAMVLAHCVSPLSGADLTARVEALLRSRMKLKQRLALKPVETT